jgi:hypothetical protein
MKLDNQEIGDNIGYLAKRYLEWLANEANSPFYFKDFLCWLYSNEPEPYR